MNLDDTYRSSNHCRASINLLQLHITSMVSISS